MNLKPFLSAIATGAKAIGLERWLYIGAACVIAIGVALFIHHERAIGKAACEKTIADAKADAERDHKEMQSRLDTESAAHDNAIIASINATPPPLKHVYAPAGPACKLTPAQLAQLRKAVQ